MKALNFAKYKWVKEELKYWYIIRDSLCIYLKLLHSELTYKLHPVQWDLFDDKVRQTISEINFDKKSKQMKKLDCLVSYQQIPKSNVNTYSTHKFYPRVKNLSSHTFSEDETKLLEKGLKYSPESNINISDFEDLAVDIDLALDDKDIGTKYICKNHIQQSVQSAPAPKNNEMKTVKRIQSTLKNENLTLVKADKGETIVILNQADYIEKVNAFLNCSSFQKIDRDPTNNYNKILKTNLTICKNIFSSSNENLINMNPLAPRLYGLPKLHKPNITIRPVVSHFTAPCHKLGYKLNNLFRNYTSFKPTYTVSNSYELCEKIKTVQVPPNARLISFDVTNLFTNVPVHESKQLVQDILNESSCDKLVKDEFMILFDTCLKQNYFRFNNVFYKQLHGLSMGSPISPLVADIFMNYLETKIFDSNNDNLKYIKYWYRYVDDILCLWTGTIDQLNEFLTFINNIHKNIKFTLEVDSNHSINFLDLKITIENNRHVFGIFRKPTFTDSIIPAKSRHHISQKMSYFHSVLHRLINIPVKDDEFQKELLIIKQIAYNNGYNANLVDEILHKKLKQKNLQSVYMKVVNDNDKKWRRIKYLGHPSTSVISKINDKITPAYYNKTTLDNLLLNCKDVYKKEERSGVYVIYCEDCDAKYIGQTGRNFEIRINEHFRSWKNKKSDSLFANHLIEFNHTFDPNKFKILHNQEKGRKLNNLEILEINKAVKSNVNLVNTQTKFNSSPLLQGFIS